MLCSAATLAPCVSLSAAVVSINWGVGGPWGPRTASMPLGFACSRPAYVRPWYEKSAPPASAGAPPASAGAPPLSAGSASVPPRRSPNCVPAAKCTERGAGLLCKKLPVAPPPGPLFECQTPVWVRRVCSVRSYVRELGVAGMCATPVETCDPAPEIGTYAAKLPFPHARGNGLPWGMWWPLAMIVPPKGEPRTPGPAGAWADHAGFRTRCALGTRASPCGSHMGRRAPAGHKTSGGAEGVTTKFELNADVSGAAAKVPCLTGSSSCSAPPSVCW